MSQENLVYPDAWRHLTGGMKFMKTKIASGILIVLALACLTISNASAGLITFNELAFNADGVIYDSFYLDSGFPVLTPTTGSLDAEGLGVLSWSVNTAGNHKFISFFDHDINYATWVNEYGATHGTLAAGQSWQIDEPGYVSGTIYTNLVAGALNNANSAPISAPNDVSMALGWDFHLNPGERGLITLVLGRDVPTSGFYLSQSSLDVSDTIYFSSSLDVKAVVVPLPGTLLLLGSGLAALLGYGRRKLM
jgi:hypothetical protein